MAAAGDAIRASDAERDAIVEMLRTHAADGRLTMTEFEDRVTEALAARTRGELDPVLRDLPPLQEPAPQRDVRRRRPPLLARLPQIAVLAMVAVAFIALFRTGAWWLIFPLFWVLGGVAGGGSCGRHRSARHGRSSRHERKAGERCGTIRV